MRNFRQVTAGIDDLDNIKTVRYIRLGEATQVLPGRPRQAQAFAAVNRISRAAWPARGLACLHFDEAQHGSVSGDDVDFAMAATVIAAQYVHPKLGQNPAGDQLAPTAKAEMRRTATGKPATRRQPPTPHPTVDHTAPVP